MESVLNCGEGQPRCQQDGRLTPMLHMDQMLQVFLRFHLFIHERHTQRKREREAETQAEGEAGSLRRSQRGTRSQDPRITP